MEDRLANLRELPLFGGNPILPRGRVLNGLVKAMEHHIELTRRELLLSENTVNWRKFPPKELKDVEEKEAELQDPMC
jgi:hypothetical protein